MCTSVPAANRRNDNLQGKGVARSEVTAHHAPALPACHQLEANDIRNMLLVGLHCEVWRLFLKE